MLPVVKVYNFPTNGEVGVSPKGRFYTCSVFYNNALYTFGGTHVHSDEYNDFWKFDFGTEKWTEIKLKSNTKVKTIRHISAILHKNEMIWARGWSAMGDDGFCNDLVGINLDDNLYSVLDEELCDTGPTDLYWPIVHKYKDKMIMLSSQGRKYLHMWELTLNPTYQYRVWREVRTFPALKGDFSRVPSFIIHDTLFLICDHGVKDVNLIKPIKIDLITGKYNDISYPDSGVFSKSILDKVDLRSLRTCTLNNTVWCIVDENHEDLMNSVTNGLYKINSDTLESTHVPDVEISHGKCFSMLADEEGDRIVVWGGTHGSVVTKSRADVTVIQFESNKPKIKLYHSLKKHYFVNLRFVFV